MGNKPVVKGSFSVLDAHVYGIQKSTDWMITFKIAGTELQFKIDTGSHATLIQSKWLKKVRKFFEPQSSDSVLRSYDNGVIRHFGTTKQLITINGKERRWNCFNAKRGHQPFLWLEASNAFGLINGVQAMAEISVKETAWVKEFSALSRGLERTRTKYKATLQEGSQPLFHSVRGLAEGLHEPLKTELHRIKKADIIQKIDTMSDWVSPLVIARKKGVS